MPNLSCTSVIHAEQCTQVGWRQPHPDNFPDMLGGHVLLLSLHIPKFPLVRIALAVQLGPFTRLRNTSKVSRDAQDIWTKLQKDFLLKRVV